MAVVVFYVVGVLQWKAVMHCSSLPVIMTTDLDSQVWSIDLLLSMAGKQER